MSSWQKADRWSMSVVWIIAPLVIAMSATIAARLTIDNTIRTESKDDLRIDETELGVAHGRIAGSLFILDTLDELRKYDAAYGRQADALVEFTTTTFDAEAARLDALDASSPDTEMFAAALIEIVDRVTAPDADPTSRFDAMVELDSRRPEFATQQGRASLELSSGVTLVPAQLTLERTVADALINDRLGDFAMAQDGTVMALEEGSAGSLPTSVTEVLFDPDQDVQAVLPDAVAALERELERTGDLQPTADWLAGFPPFFEGGPSAIDAPPSTVDDDIDAAVSLFIRIDRTVASEMQRVINADRVDVAQRSNRGWAIGIFSAIVAVAMLALAAAATIRRRKEFTLLEVAASLDSLTGLANRRHFDSRVAQHLASGVAGASGHALFHIDIDEFEQINDALGRAAGDDVLCELSRRLESTVERWRESLPVADAHAGRLGGDEFMVALHGVDLELVDLGQLADDLCEHIGGPVGTVAGPAELKVSIGCSTAVSGTALDEVMKRSDLALYDAKRSRSNRSSVFADADQVHWEMPSVTERILANQEPTVSASSDFVRELVDLTQRFGVELTTSTRPGAHSSTGTDGIRVNLILVESSNEPRPNRRFTDFPANAGGPPPAAGPAPSEQH